MTIFTIQLSECQVQLIHDAVDTQLSVLRKAGLLTPGLEEELTALFDMSDKFQTELYPQIGIINGWVL